MSCRFATRQQLAAFFVSQTELSGRHLNCISKYVFLFVAGDLKQREHESLKVRYRHLEYLPDVLCV